jgi:hypothetical protein
MADRTIKVITPATNFDFLTLDEAKQLLGLLTADTSHDEQITMMISIFSQTIAEYCHRVFARETVIETWREEFNGRLFLSHWPVKEADIQVVSAGSAWTNGTVVPPVVLDASQYELEEASGKLSFIANPGGTQSMSWDWPTVVTYTGGYDLPAEAPLPLKQATTLLIMEARMRLQQAQVAGIRSISHKESRIMFFDPNMLLAKILSAHTVGLNPAVDALLKRYIRVEV